jgi:hypothetical protein
MSRPKYTALLSLAAFLSVGCAAQLSLMERRAVAGGPMLSFWPPPESSTTWSASAGLPSGVSLGESADQVAAALRSAGYTDARWYAIGARYAHGFAVTTRLEKINDDGTPKPPSERWSSRFPEASTLFWLERARRMRLPGPGRYRVFLVAFTDLPIGRTNRAPYWNEDTWMADVAEAPSLASSQSRSVSPTYRVGTYVYAYESDSADGKGELLASDVTPATAHIQSSGLSALIGSSSGGAAD